MKTFVRGLIAVLVVMSIILSVACGKNGEEPGGSESLSPGKPSDLIGSGIKVGLITPIGGLGDGTIGDATYQGLRKAQEVLGFELDYSEPMSSPDYEAIIIEYASSGEYDLIFSSSSDGYEPVNAVGPQFPNQKFIQYDIEAAGNTQYVAQYFAKNEIGFLGGVLSALMEEKGEVTIAGKTTTFEPSGKIGLMIGKEVPSTVPAITGAAAGIKYVKPDYEYIYGIVGDWKDQAANKELALSLYDQGVHIIFQNAGGGGLGIIAAAQERGQFFVGYDTDQTHWDPERVLGSSKKENDATILRVMTQFCETGELPWGTAEVNGAANGGISFSYNPDLVVPDDVAATIEQVMEDLKAGRIVAPNTWDEVKDFTDVMTR